MKEKASSSKTLKRVIQNLEGQKHPGFDIDQGCGHHQKFADQI